ncbi:ferric reductase-like transmembrane domain-containing protein [Robertmurraya andreesenii]|uniref:Ferric reductase n=1 Tax=Anoxybacillus andreesenii TaxID=1325932 RepID=A0ABT9V9L2_9BACL|nr:ferric reductase-like transmembrane domain-containing protein [Robertmurraya andreesenii]MDQ0157608.1 putative ferric reductase [Robertmurraya andreesenii]
MDVPFISNWVLIRLSGFLAYFLFTFSISAGLLSRLAVFQKKRPLMNELHQTSGWAGVLTVIFHMILLWRDRFVTYTLGEIFIPFFSDHAPLASGIGTICFYLFLIVFVTSDFLMKRLGKNLWRKIHLLVIPAWIFMVLHGFLIGTDSNLPWAAFLYGGGVFLVVTIMSLRYLESYFNSLADKNDAKKTP